MVWKLMKITSKVFLRKQQKDKTDYVLKFDVAKRNDMYINIELRPQILDFN